MTVSLKPLFMPVEAFLGLSLKPSLWMFIRLAHVRAKAALKTQVKLTPVGKLVTTRSTLNFFGKSTFQV